MPFDPSAPFAVEEEPAKFDPSASFTVEEPASAQSKFDPNQSFEVEAAPEPAKPSLMERAVSAIQPGAATVGEAMRKNALPQAGVPSLEVPLFGPEHTLTRGLSKAIKGVAESALTPEGVALMGALPVPVVGPVIGTALGVMAAKEAGTPLGRYSVTKDPEDLGEGAAMGALGVLGTVAPVWPGVKRLTRGQEVAPEVPPILTATEAELEKSGIKPPKIEESQTQASPKPTPPVESEAPNALQVGKSETLPLETPPETRAEVGTQVRQPEEPAVPPQPSEQPPREAPQAPDVGDVAKVRVFHGSPNEVTGELRVNKADDFPLIGISVSSEKSVASRYASDVDLRKGGAKSPSIISLDFNGRVVDVSDLRKEWEKTGKPWEDQFTNEITDFARSKGYDAVDLASAGMGEPGEIFILNQKALTSSAPKVAGEAPQATPVGDVAKAPAEAAPEIIGMGGATPSEFKPPGGSPTSLKNAAVDAERVKRGLEPMMAKARQSWGSDWDKAMAKIDQDPAYQDRLLAEMAEEPRALEGYEHAALLHRYTDLLNEYEKSAREAAQAYDDGRMEDMQAASVRTAEWSDKMAAVELVSKSVGSKSGQSLAARKMMANRDFTLASLELQKRAANDFRPLTDTERAELVKKADDYARVNAELEQKLTEREQRLAETQSKLSVAEIEASKVKDRKVSDYVLGIAESWVKQWGKEAEVARKNLAGKFLSPSPADLLDLAKIVRFRIGEIGLDAAKIGVELVSEFGEGVRPYIDGAIKTAQEMIEKAAKRLPKGTEERVREAVTKQAPTIESVKDKIKAKVEKDDEANITPLTKKLAEMLWDQGVRGHDPMIDALHPILKEFIPEITRQETMDALSGRGRFFQASQDATKKGVRDLSTQARLISHQMDVEARKPLPRTGFQPDKYSDQARQELQKLEELKRKFGVVVTDPAAQLASALQAQKTYLTYRMADLRQEIATRERIVKTKTPLEPDAELTAMRAEYETVKAEHEAIFPRQEATPEQRIAAANRSLDRAIANLEKDLAEGKLFKEKQPSKTPVTPELTAKRARLEALREQRQELRDIANPKKTPLERALQSRKTRLKNRIAELEEKLANKDFSTKVRPEPPTDPEVENLQFREAEIKKQFQEELIADKMARRSMSAKIFGGVAEGVNLVRNIMTSPDFSAVLNQGAYVVLPHPIRSARSIMPMLRAFQSPAKALAEQKNIMKRTNYPLYKKYGLFLSELGQSLAQMEEQFMSRLAGKIPLVAGSQRAYTAFLNKLRADSFDAMYASLARGGGITVAEGKIIANFVNAATGRGTIGVRADAAAGLNTFFFAPRYVASRIQMETFQPLWHGAVFGKVPFKGTGRARALVAYEYGRILGAVAVVYTLGALSGAEIETDPRSSDFGKLKYGKSRVDFLAGILQNTVFVSRLITGKTKTASGKVEPIVGKKVPFGKRTADDVILRFFRSKLAPVPGAIYDIATKKDFNGNPTTVAKTALGLVTPMTGKSIYDAMREHGIPSGVALSILSFFGARVDTYD